MKVKVCCWKNCKANFSEYIVKRIKADIERLDLKDIELEETMCMWMCKDWPNVVIDDEIIHFAEPAKISERIIYWKKKKKKKNNISKK